MEQRRKHINPFHKSIGHTLIPVCQDSSDVGFDHIGQLGHMTKKPSAGFASFSLNPAAPFAKSLGRLSDRTEPVNLLQRQPHLVCSSGQQHILVDPLQSGFLFLGQIFRVLQPDPTTLDQCLPNLRAATLGFALGGQDPPLCWHGQSRETCRNTTRALLQFSRTPFA